MHYVDHVIYNVLKTSNVFLGHAPLTEIGDIFVNEHDSLGSPGNIIIVSWPFSLSYVSIRTRSAKREHKTFFSDFN